MIDRNFISVVAEGEKIYWLTERYGFGMCLDTESNTVSYLDIPWKKSGIIPYSCGILAIENGIMYGVCCFGKYLMIFDMNNRELRVHEIGLEDYLALDFSFAIKSVEEIAVLPYASDKVFFINVTDGKVTNKTISEKAEEKKLDFNYAGVHEVFDEKSIPIFKSEKNEYYIWNTVTGDMEKKTYPSAIAKPLYLQETDDKYFILTFGGDVYSLDKSGGKVNLVYKYEPKQGDGEIPFCEIAVVQEVMWLLPCYGKRILKVDFNSRNVQEFSEIPNDLEYSGVKKMSNYSRCVTAEGKTYFAMHTGNYMFCINEDGRGEFLDIKWPDEKEYTKRMLEMSQIIEEGEITLESFVGTLL